MMQQCTTKEDRKDRKQDFILLKRPNQKGKIQMVDKIHIIEEKSESSRDSKSSCSQRSDSHFSDQNQQNASQTESQRFLVQ